MTTSKKTKTAPVKITAPKISTAWNKVCATSGKAETEIIAAIENLSAVLVLESGLSVADMKKVIKDTGKESSFIKASHVPALQTWSKLRALHADFKALPIAKQLSTAMASYDLLGSGKGEQIKTLEALTKEIATVRKAKQSAKPADPAKPAKAKKTVRETLEDILKFANSLDAESIGEADFDLLLEIAGVLEQKTMAGVDA
ncbi:MAG: hypothetical protein EBR60_05885 [Burkholderiaceae bacterium]|nr:hypothetical protein [Burkholderiaceae bacterium]